MAGCNKRPILTIVATCIILFFGIYLGFEIGLFPIIISNAGESFNTREDSSLNCAEMDSVIKPFEKITFNKMVLLLDFDDYDDCCGFPEYIPRRKVLWKSDTVMIKSLKSSTWHTCGEDICTISSKLLLFNNNHLVKTYEILLGSNMVGIQSQETGWVKAIDTEEIISIFSNFSSYSHLLFCIDI